MMKWFLHIIQSNRNNNQSLLQDWHRQHIGPEKQQPTMSTATENWSIHPWSKKQKGSGLSENDFARMVENYGDLHAYNPAWNVRYFLMNPWNSEQKSICVRNRSLGCGPRMPETSWKLTCIPQSIIPYPYQCGMSNLYQRTHETNYKPFWMSETDCWGAMKDGKLWTLTTWNSFSSPI